jgi:hypothetical protein
MIRAAAKGLSLTPRLMSVGFGGSDHASFMAVRVPVLFLTSGTHADYHTPADTAEKINCRGAVVVLRLAERLVMEMWTGRRRPVFAAGSPADRPANRPAVPRGGNPRL